MSYVCVCEKGTKNTVVGLIGENNPAGCIKCMNREGLTLKSSVFLSGVSKSACSVLLLHVACCQSRCSDSSFQQQLQQLYFQFGLGRSLIIKYCMTDRSGEGRRGWGRGYGDECRMCDEEISSKRDRNT